jgi:hypothetical protein
MPTVAMETDRPCPVEVRHKPQKDFVTGRHAADFIAGIKTGNLQYKELQRKERALQLHSSRARGLRVAGGWGDVVLPDIAVNIALRNAER